MSTFISVGGYEASAMLNEPAFWLAPFPRPPPPSIRPCSVHRFHPFTLPCSSPPLLRPERIQPPSSAVLVRRVSFSPSVLRKLDPRSILASSPSSTPSRALVRSPSLSVGHEGASIPRPSVLCTPRSLMGRVRSGQPEGKLIPRRSDGNAFLARPPPPPATRSLFLALCLCPLAPSFCLAPSSSFSLSLSVVGGKSRGKRRRSWRFALGYIPRGWWM